VSDSAVPTTCEAPPARPACADRHRPRGSTVVDLTRPVLQYSRPQPALTRSPGYAGQGVSILAHQACQGAGPRATTSRTTSVRGTHSQSAHR
jgi:hypothetical protein